VAEKKMFGGLAFLVGRQHGGRRQRSGPAACPGRPGRRSRAHRGFECPPDGDAGREMAGWLRLDSADVGTEEAPAPWVRRGLAYARSLPPKRSPRRFRPRMPESSRAL
jgi:hypothetical protein